MENLWTPVSVVPVRGERKDEPGGAPVRLDRECRNRGLHERVGERIGVYGKATKGGA